jgi:hypothetical protein
LLGVWRFLDFVDFQPTDGRSTEEPDTKGFVMLFGSAKPIGLRDLALEFIFSVDSKIM